VDIAGPAGLFALKKTPARKIFLVTGTGVAPVRSFLLSDPSQALNSVLYWGLKDLSEIFLFNELLDLKRVSSTFFFQYCLSQQPSFDIIPADLLHYFRAGHIDTVWTAQTASINPLDEYYICGSREVVESLRLLLLSRGVSKNNLFFEKY